MNGLLCPPVTPVLVRVIVHFLIIICFLNVVLLHFVSDCTASSDQFPLTLIETHYLVHLVPVHPQLTNQWLYYHQLCSRPA